MPTPKRVPLPLDETLLELNESLLAILEAFVPPDEEVDIRFDLPSQEEMPDQQTISAFLYKVHENLDAKTSSVVQYQPATQTMGPQYISIRFSYLITYWGSPSMGGKAHAGHPRSDSMKMANYILNALVNSYYIRKEFPGMIAHIIRPEEGLNSLGNFWQSMGNKPRLSYGFEATVPVALAALEDVALPVRSAHVGVAQKPAGDVPAAAAERLAQRLLDTLSGTAPLDQPSRAQLSQLRFACTVPAAQTEGEISVAVALGGVLDTALKARVEAVIATWTPALNLGDLYGLPLHASQVDLALAEVK